MKNLSQAQYVAKQLETKGYITRNQALNKNITRLSAIIFDLREAGYKIVAHWVATRQNPKSDYRYNFVSKND